jgi:Kringle domain
MLLDVGLQEHDRASNSAGVRPNPIDMAGAPLTSLVSLSRIDPPIEAIAVLPVGTANDPEDGIHDGSETGRDDITEPTEPITNAALVNEEEVVEAKPALECFQALVHNKRFKYLVAGFLLILLSLIILVPRNQAPTIEQGGNATAFECGTALTSQADYRGTISVTTAGIACRPWASQSPRSHDFSPEKYPDADLSENYCK